jgi:hypothetical protein
MAELQSDENPILQRRAQLALAVAERLTKCRHPLQLRDFSGEGAILKLVVMSQLKRASM